MNAKPGISAPSPPRRWRRRSLLWLGSLAGTLAIILGVGLLLPGCAVGYVTRQSATHLRVLAARQPLEKAMARGKIPEAWLPGIEAIQQARDFGTESLELPAADLYRSISLVRPEPMYIVTACARDALQPTTWWFPFTGRVAYRGYYDKEDAEHFAHRLRRLDLDVLVQESDAFSSLGWFSDPIRPAMLTRSRTSLVNLVLHEAAHRVVYYKGQTDFNESFASFVGDEGTVRFLEQQATSIGAAAENETSEAGCSACERLRGAYADAASFSLFMQTLIDDLETLYAEPVSRDEKLARREQAFSAAHERFASLPWQSQAYAWFPSQQLDNAVVLSLRRYEGRRELFQRLLDRCGGDLSAAITAVSTLEWDRLPRSQRRTTDPFTLLEQRFAEDALCQEDAPAPAASKVLSSGMAPVNDIQMYYEIHGAGPPLILLHGGLGNTVNWGKQVPFLARQFKVISVDSRGHGRSTFTDQRITYTLMAADIVVLMDYLGIEKAHILGWSDGAIIGLDLAIRHPDRLNKVIAYGANYNPSGMRADVGENEKIKNFIENAAKDYQTLSPEPEHWDAFLENIGQMWATEPNITAEQLGSITIPVLILDGDNDEAIFTEHTREMAGLIPAAELTLIPGTGHFAMWEKPDEINRVILEFLIR